MSQVAYAPAANPQCAAISVSIFADRRHVREEMRGDSLAAGLGLRDCGELGGLLEGDPCALGDVVLIDCPRPMRLPWRP